MALVIFEQGFADTRVGSTYQCSHANPPIAWLIYVLCWELNELVRPTATLGAAQLLSRALCARTSRLRFGGDEQRGSMCLPDQCTTLFSVGGRQRQPAQKARVPRRPSVMSSEIAVVRPAEVGGTQIRPSERTTKRGAGVFGGRSTIRQHQIGPSALRGLGSGAQITLRLRQLPQDAVAGSKGPQDSTTCAQAQSQQFWKRAEICCFLTPCAAMAYGMASESC